MRRRLPWLGLALGAGYAFLYLPMALLVLLSFNDSRMVTRWSGFSVRWYVALWNNEALIEAALLSLRIAATSATGALVLGTLAGFALARLGVFRGRTLFGAMVTAPLVMPEVITGLSLLLLFVALAGLVGWPGERGVTTITLAHITFATAYVAVVVQSRLVDFDDSLEEAAMDLGARPWTVFRTITLPLIAPALASGWLLAFTLSLDDLVIASFTSGPGATTLPMVVFSAMRLGLTPELFALATIIIAVVTVALVVALRLARVASGPSRV